jgi:dTDP-4-dehydrorhamnose reductase
MGLQMLDVLKLPPTLAEPVSFQDVPAVAARAANVSLDSSRAYGLGFDPPTVRKQIEWLLGKSQPLMKADEKNN